MHQEAVARIAESRDPMVVAKVLSETFARRIGWGSYAFAALESGVRTRAHYLVESLQWAPSSIDFPEVLRAIDRDVGGLGKLLERVPGAFDIKDHIPQSMLKGTELQERHWGPMQVIQQVCGPLRYQGQALGYCVVTRGAKDPIFTEEDVRVVEALRLEAERAIAATMVMGDADVEGTLAVLTSSYPLPAFLFDADGRLQWASEEGTLRLGLEALRLGSGCLVKGNEALAQLSRAARSAATDIGFDVDVPLRRAGILRGGERAVARRFRELGKATVLVALAPPAVAALPALGGASPDRVPGLGASESAVVRLAAEGYTVLNMSARLGITEATVRTHLRRAYAKLGVHSRAELAMVLFQGRR